MTPPRLLIIGDIAWDVLLRPSGELVWGADVYGHVDLMAGGSAANVAVWARRHGAAVTLVGQVGDDRFGHLMRAHLADEGVAEFIRVVPGGQTMRIGVVVRPDAEHAFVTDHSRPLRLTADDLPLALLDQTDAVFLNGYAVFMAGSAAFASPLLAEARRRGILVAFDPSSFSLIRAHRATPLLDEVGPLDVLLANEDEARTLVPRRTARRTAVPHRDCGRQAGRTGCHRDSRRRRGLGRGRADRRRRHDGRRRCIRRRVPRRVPHPPRPCSRARRREPPRRPRRLAPRRARTR